MPDAGWGQRLAWRAEAAAVYGVWGLMRALPPVWASGLCGAVARTVGPWLPVSRVARDNLRRHLPELPDSALPAVIRGVWDNLGRTVGESPHLETLLRDRVTVIGGEHIHAARESGAPVLFVSAHIANWELVPATPAREGMASHVVYRAINNPYIDALVRRWRAPYVRSLLPKGASGARALARVVRAGDPAGLLVDQKANDGIAVPFLNGEAMTAPAVALMARHFKAQVVPLRARRLPGVRFEVIVEPPLPVPHTEDRDADILALMTAINARVAAWVRDTPEQWLWLHRRWPKSDSHAIGPKTGSN